MMGPLMPTMVQPLVHLWEFDLWKTWQKLGLANGSERRIAGGKPKQALFKPPIPLPSPSPFPSPSPPPPPPSLPAPMILGRKIGRSLAETLRPLPSVSRSSRCVPWAAPRPRQQLAVPRGWGGLRGLTKRAGEGGGFPLTLYSKDPLFSGKEVFTMENPLKKKETHEKKCVF